VAFRFTTAGAVWRPKKSCKVFLKYEINNENITTTQKKYEKNIKTFGGTELEDGVK